jgi:hypothetical protein
VIKVKVSSALSGTSTDFSKAIEVSFLSWFPARRVGENVRIVDELIEFTRPERIELNAKRGHPPSVQAVVLESSFSSARDETDVGEHAQVLRDRRPAHGEIAG